MSITKVDDPVYLQAEFSSSDKVVLIIQDSEFAFDQNAKGVLSRDMRKKTRIKTFTIEDEDMYLDNGKAVIDISKYTGNQKELYFEFDGFGDGNRFLVKRIIINKSAL